MLLGEGETPFSEKKWFPFPQTPILSGKSIPGRDYLPMGSWTPVDNSAKPTPCVRQTSRRQQPLRPAPCSAVIPCPKAFAGGLGGLSRKGPPRTFCYFSVTKSRTLPNHATSYSPQHAVFDQNNHLSGRRAIPALHEKKTVHARCRCRCRYFSVVRTGRYSVCMIPAGPLRRCAPALPKGGPRDVMRLASPMRGGARRAEGLNAGEHASDGSCRSLEANPSVAWRRQLP